MAYKLVKYRCGVTDQVSAYYFGWAKKQSTSLQSIPHGRHTTFKQEYKAQILTSSMCLNENFKFFQKTKRNAFLALLPHCNCGFIYYKI